MAQPLHDYREIRIVISPTFRNVQQERDHLMSIVFPRLIHLAEERQVTVQLKWNTPLDIDGIDELNVSLDVEENPHPYVFVKKEFSELGSRHDQDGVARYDYTTPDELGHALEKVFVQLLDKLYPNTSVIELEKALVKAAKIYWEMERLEDALDLETRAYNVLKESIGDENVDAIEALYACGWLNYKLLNYDKALELLNRTVELAKMTFGEFDPRTTDYVGIIRMVEASAKRAKKQ